MVEIKGSSEADARAREFINGRHFRVRQILFSRVQRGINDWLLEGEVWIKLAYFFTSKRSFRLWMKPETGEITSYEEWRYSAT